MHPFRILTAIVLSIFLINNISGQSINCDTKRSFHAVEGTSLNLTNKYGDINIISDDVDSVTICATIIINQDDIELLKKNNEFITININMSEDKISVSTQFDNRFFSSYYRKGRESFSVDYLIKLPSYINVTLTNSFGNISCGELSGIVNIKLSQGQLIAKKLSRGNSSPFNSVNADHCSINIDYVNWISLTARQCPDVNIGNAQALMIISDFSKIFIGSVSSLVAKSKSDSYSIDLIKNIVSESVYSSFDIETLYGKMQAKTVLGSLSVAELKKDFSTVEINSVNTPVIIETGKDVSFKCDLTGINNPIDFSYQDDPGITESGSNNIKSFKGLAGTDKNTSSEISIHATNGKLTIR